MFDFDGTGIDADSKGTSRVLPKRWYDFKVMEFVARDGKRYPLEGFTKNKDPMVNIMCEVINDPQYNGERVFHTVTFLPKDKPGAGMAIHWLKTIRQPWQDKFKVNADAWINETFKGFVVQDEYKGRIKNKLGEVKPMVEEKEEVPF